ncbi:MAG TPA: 50S ribosomal protein L29 [Xylella sp.]
MDFKSLSDKSVNELKTHLLELRKEQFSMRMQLAMGQFKKTHEMLRARRDIARIKHVLCCLNKVSAS